MAKKTIGMGQITIVDLNDGPGYSPNLLKGTKTGPLSWGSDYPEAHTVTTALNAEGFREMTQTRTTTGAQVSCWKFVESMIDGGALPFRLFRDGQRYTLSFDYKSTAPVDVYLDMRQNYLGKVFIAPQTQFPASAEWRRASISQVLEMPELNLLKGENTTAWRTVTVSKSGYGLAAPMTPLANLGLKPGDTVSIGMEVRTSSGRILRARLRYRHGGDYGNVMGITTVQNGTKRLEVTGTLPSDCTEVGVALDGGLTSPVSGTETQEEVRAVCLRKGTSGSSAANPEDLRFLLLGATLANPCAAGDTASFRKFCVVEGGSESWVPALSEMQGAKGDKGDNGEQGYGIVASVTRDGKTPEWWDTYAATGHTETWTGTSGTRNGCRVNDLFQVIGTDTAGGAHAATYRSTTASGNLVGTCIGHTVTKAGLGVDGVDEHFALSNSNTPPAKTASGWQTNPPTTPVPTATNRWLWNYETIRYSDGTSTETPVHTACVYGEDGKSLAVKSTVSQWCLATQGTTPPTSGWQSAIPASVPGQYLWCRTTVTYTDGITDTPSVTYSCARQGTNGANGANGAGYTNNLLMNSDFKDGSKYYFLPPNVTIDTTMVFQGRNSVKSAQSGLTQDSWYGPWYAPTGNRTDYWDAKPGDQITLSVWVYVEDLSTVDSSIILQMSWRDDTTRLKSATMSAKPTKEKEWQHFVLTSPVAPEGTTKNEVRAFVTRNGTAWFNGFKAEYGVNAKPVWTPYAEAPRITKTETKYLKGAALTSQPTDAQFDSSTQTTPGTLTKGTWLWSRAVTEWSDGQKSKTYNSSYIGGDGADGTPGANGYTHIAYCSSITGTLPTPTAVSGFSTVPFDGAKYIGFCTNNEKPDPGAEDFAQYKWSRYVGDDGNGILSVTDFYLATATQKEPTSADTGWKTKISDTSYSPTNRFLWNKERTLYTQKAATERIHILSVWGERGPAGDWTSYVFKTSGTQPATPTDTQNTIPTGWVDAPTSSGRWWMSKATINGVTGKPGTWSTPVQCTGEDGKDGPYTDFKYRVHADLSSPVVDRSMRNPTGWEDEPPTRPSGYNLWMITAEIDADDNIIGQWSLPTKINGEKGEDAVSVALVPETLTFHKGVKSAYLVNIEAYKGTEKLTPSSYDMLDTDTLAQYGLTWRQAPLGYRLIYDGTKDVNLNLPVNVTIDGKTYARTLALRSIADGEKGDPGLAGPIQRVTEWAPGVDYRCDTEPGEDGRMFLDIVTVSRSVSEFDAFVCKVAHTSSADNKPGLDPENPGGDYWTAMSDTGPIYTPFLLAPNANIKFAQSQQILITDEQGNVKAGLAGRGNPIWTGNETPALGNFTIDTDGNGRWGLADGRRIEIRPKEGEIQIYDQKPTTGEAPLRTVITGTPIPASARIPTGGATTTLVKTDYNNVDPGSLTGCILSGKATENGTVKLNLPAINIHAEVSASASTTTSARATARLYIIIGTSTVYETNSLSAFALNDGVSKKTDTVTIPASKMQFSINAGEIVRVMISSTITRSASGASCYASITPGSQSGTIVYDDIKCIYATNGIHLSRDSDNFFYAIFDSAGRLYVGCKANGKVVFKSDSEPI